MKRFLCFLFFFMLLTCLESREIRWTDTKYYKTKTVIENQRPVFQAHWLKTTGKKLTHFEKEFYDLKIKTEELEKENSSLKAKLLKLKQNKKAPLPQPEVIKKEKTVAPSFFQLLAEEMASFKGIFDNFNTRIQFQIDGKTQVLQFELQDLLHTPVVKGNLQLEIPLISLANLVSKSKFLSRFQFPIKPLFSGGILYFNGEFHREKASWQKFEGKAGVKDASVLLPGQKLSPGPINIQMQLKGQKIDGQGSTNLLGRDQKIKFQISNLFNHPLFDGTFDLSLDCARFYKILVNLGFFNKPELKFFKIAFMDGTVSGKFKVQQKMADLKTLSFAKLKLLQKSEIYFDRVRFSSVPYKFFVRYFSGQLYLTPSLDELQLQNFSIRMKKSKVSFFNNIQLKPSINFNLSYRASLEGDEITPVISNFTGKIKKIAGHYELTGRVYGPKKDLKWTATAKKDSKTPLICKAGLLEILHKSSSGNKTSIIPFQKFNATIAYESKRIYFRKAKAMVFAGNISFNEAYLSQREDANNTFFKFQGDCSGLDLKTVSNNALQAAKQEKSIISGVGAGNFNITGSVNSAETINGRGAVLVENLKIDPSRFIEKGIKRDLFKSLNLSERKWEKIRTKFKIVKGWLELENLDLSGPNVRLNGKGRMHLFNLHSIASMKGTLYGNVLDNFRILLSKKHFDKNNHLPFYLKVNGSLDDFKSWDTDLFNKFKKVDIIENTKKDINKFLNQKLFDLFK
ncbi:AsmA-like C-terminal region-containing protein [Candidatus Riflebacteria bacterium]